jgi:hypothetical protein
MTLSVVGAGVGRTGTLSLKLALERLGFGPCYHMKEIFDHHLQGHVPLWTRAAEGEAIDWDLIFRDYRSAVDFPAAAFYREIADFYPGSQVILTVRDKDKWYESFKATIQMPLTQKMPEMLGDWSAMVRRGILDRVFGGQASDRAHVIERYEHHNEEVVRTIPPERLLVYDVSQGWEPLCSFLGVPVPEEPFPRVNTTSDFRERIAPLFQS